MVHAGFMGIWWYNIEVSTTIFEFLSEGVEIDSILNLS